MRCADKGLFGRAGVIGDGSLVEFCLGDLLIFGIEDSQAKSKGSIFARLVVYGDSHNNLPVVVVSAICDDDRRLIVKMKSWRTAQYDTTGESAVEEKVGRFGAW